MAALTPQQLADLQTWVDTYAAATDELSARTAAAITSVYAGQSFWAPASASAVAEQAASMSSTANLIAAGMASQYVAQTLAATVGHAVPVPNVPLPPIRNGVPLEAVFDRPMKLFRRKVSEGMEPAAAYDLAMRLATALVDGNIRLAKRDELAHILDRLPAELGVTGYRRVVHPELSRTGSCGLCIVASDQVYKRGDLMPLHAHCHCEPVPIIAGIDPGSSLNNMALGDFYAAAGDRKGATRKSGTAAVDLKEVRVKVRQHGEWGPVLTRSGQHFLSASDLEPVVSAAA